MLQKHIKYVKVLKRILVKIFLVCLAEIKLKLANLSVKTKLRNKDKLVDLLSRTQQ